MRWVHTDCMYVLWKLYSWSLNFNIEHFIGSIYTIYIHQRYPFASISQKIYLSSPLSNQQLSLSSSSSMDVFSFYVILLLSTTVTVTGSSTSSPPLDPFQSLPPQGQYPITTLPHPSIHKSSPPWAIILSASALGLVLLAIGVVIVRCCLLSQPATDAPVMGIPLYPLPPNNNDNNNNNNNDNQVWCLPYIYRKCLQLMFV